MTVNRMSNAARFAVAATVFACFTLIGLPQHVRAQDSGKSYTVKESDKRIRDIAKRLRYKDTSLEQMTVAMVRENINAFETRKLRQLKVGYKLVIPTEASVNSVSKEDAQTQFVQLVRADGIYRVGVSSEQKGETRKALRMYLYAAKLGHILADLRLGELYDRDPSGKIPHDLQTSIKFYQLARKAGVKIEGPLSRMPTGVN